MLLDAAFKIGGDADIQSAPLVIGDDIGISTHACSMLTEILVVKSRGWRNVGLAAQYNLAGVFSR
jgi:hypothetical protein